MMGWKEGGGEVGEGFGFGFEVRGLMEGIEM